MSDRNEVCRALGHLVDRRHGLRPALYPSAVCVQRARCKSFGRAGEALALLEKRELALPDNYNPPHLRARIYRSQKRWDEGLAAIERALARAYGPRRANLMSLKVDLLIGARRKADARAALEAQIEAYQPLPDGQKLPDAEAAARKRLADSN